MMKKSLICLVALILLSSCNDRGDSLKVSDWKVLYNQSENIDEVISSAGWIDMEIDEPISLPYPEKGDIQYIWLKGGFTASEDYENLYGISIARLSMVDRSYINGNLVGYVDEEEMNSLDSPRNYVIPAGLINYGKNSLFIRAGVYDRWDLEISGAVMIQDADNFKKTRNLYHLISEIIPFSILTLIAGTFFSLLFKSANEKWNREYLMLALRLLIVVLCYLTFYSPIPLFSLEVILAIWNMALPLLFLSMALLYQEIAKMRFENLNRIVIPFLAVTAAAVFALTLLNMNGPMLPVLVGFSVTAAMGYIFYLFFRIVRNRKRDYKLILLLADAVIITANIGIVALFLLFDITIIDPSFLSISSGLFLTVLFSIYFARREAKHKLKMESLSAKINEIEQQSKKGREYNISPALESKLEEITLFIKSNFSNSITREELAETVGVNPNYFSTLFNMHTGKKVNEYINDLRLHNASEKLINHNDSITDVAFSSGFESLATFNRLFKKRYGSSPGEYRNQRTISEK